MSEVRHGMATVSDGKSKPQPIRLQLTTDCLTLQKEELVYMQQDLSTSPDSRIRIVKVHRQKVGSLGLSIKGGAEHKLPILISKIFPGQAADQTQHLFVGDAILKVNNISIEHFSHDDAVDVLRTAGNEVLLTVRHHRAVTPFLTKTSKTNYNMQTDSSQNSPDLSSGESSQSEQLNKLSEYDDFQVDASPKTNSPQFLPKLQKRWTDITVIPLLMAYITRYIIGSDKLRPNSFEVRGMDGTSSGIIHCDEASNLSDWVKHICNNIIALNNHSMKIFNKHLPPVEQTVYIGWCCEWTQNANPWHSWKPKFLALKGSDVYLFNSPPATSLDWPHSEATYKIYETMFRILKDSEYVDERQHCFIVQTGHGTSHYLSTETRAELLRIENSWHRTLYHAVTWLGSKTFACISHNKSSGLTLDFNMGFALYDSEEKNYIWKYKFSQLRGSSDDGKTKVKLHFQDLPSRQIETKEVECFNLQTLLFCIHSFLTAKLVSVDPNFLRSS